MGCGIVSATKANQRPDFARRVSVLDINAPNIPIVVGNNARFLSPPTIPIFFIFGGPGSRKGRIVANLRSMFGMKLISAENVILKYLPKRLQHFVTLSTVDDISEIVRKEPSHVQLDWVLRLIQHLITSDPHKMYIVDLIPNLRWLVRNESLVNHCTSELSTFEEKTPVAFALHLSLTEDSLGKTLDYSHQSCHLPQGITVADEADSLRTKRRFQLHENVVQPFLTYFSSSERLVTIDVSSGAAKPIWDCIHNFFIQQNLSPQVLIDSVVVFAMEGLCVGNLDLRNCDMIVVYLKDIVPDPNAPVETLIELLCNHIHRQAPVHPYFVVDPSSTSIISATPTIRTDKMVVFSDVPDKDEGCINRFTLKLNSLIGGSKPYFKGLCCDHEVTLLFPSTVPDDLCHHIAFLMAENHVGKL